MSDKEVDLTEVKKSVLEVGKAFEAFKTSNDERLKEVMTKGDADTLIEEKLERINQHMDEHQAAIDKFIAQQKRKSFYPVEGGKSPEELDAKALQFAQINAKARGTSITEYTHQDLQEYKTAFLSFMRKDERALSATEMKALSVGSDPDGGYLVYPDMSGRIVGRVFETSPVRQYASIQSVSTDALEGTHDADEAASGWVEETASRPETDTPEIKRWRIPVHEQYAAPRATQKLVDDAAINMEAWLAGKVADKLSRVENAAFVTGDGVGKPRGFLTYPDYTTAGAFEIGAIEQFDTGVNGDFAAAPAGGDVLLNAVYGLKAPYRANGVWFMNRTTTGAARKLKDSDGAYLWQPGIQAGQPASLLGYPVASYEDMPSSTTTGALAIAFGDMGAAYQIVDRVGIRVLRDPYTAKPYIIYYTTKRVGGDVVNFEALKLIKFSA